MEQNIVGADSIETFWERWQEQESIYQKAFTAPDAKILVADDNKMNLKVFRSLLRETKVGIDEAESGEETLKQYRIQVHSMKSIAGLIGAAGLSDMAKELETAAHAQSVDFIVQNTCPFLEEWEAHHKRLESVFSNDKEKCLLESDVVVRKLSELREAFATMDVDQMDALMCDINEYAFPTDMTKDIEKLNVLVTDLDEENAIPLMETLYQKLMV